MKVNAWLIAPVMGLFLLGAAGWSNALVETMDSSVALARSSEEAPITTGAAAAEVRHLPQVALVTEQQAIAFDALADALSSSAKRVEALNASLSRQVSGVESLASALRSVLTEMPCLSSRLERLIEVSALAPPALDRISSTLNDLSRAQAKALRHLRSINRKLAALGAVATATGVEPPPPPPDAHEPEAGDDPGLAACL